MPRLPSLLRLPSKLSRRTRRRRMTTLLGLLAIILIFIFPLYVIYKPPAILIRYVAYRWPDVLWQVSWPPSTLGPSATPKPLLPIALTIDDAPSEYTRDILALLRTHDAHATFFIIGGQVAGREAVLRDIVRAGHELGNHAMHDEVARSLSDAELEAQIHTVQQMIVTAYVAAGRTPPDALAHRYFRPGSGFFSGRMRALLARLGYRLVLGSIYPHDPQIPYPWINARHILSMLRPGGIIICHDRRSWTPPMLADVLPRLKKKGYEAVTVTQLLKDAGA